MRVKRLKLIYKVEGMADAHVCGGVWENVWVQVPFRAPIDFIAIQKWAAFLFAI